MSQSFLSIALATYNGERFLGEQLKSIAWQTRLPDELVVRDDASTDSTVALLHSFADRAPFPVHIIRGEQNIGYVQNFGEAIRHCTGDLIALSDQDDVWLPHKLQRMEKALSADSMSLLAFSDLELVDASLRPLGQRMWETLGLEAEIIDQFDQGWRRSPLLSKYYVTGASMCFRASLVPLALPFELSEPHDGWLALLAALRGRVIPIPEPLVLYRQHGGNQIGARESEGLLAKMIRWTTAWSEGNRAVTETMAARRDLLLAARDRVGAISKLAPGQAAVLTAYARHAAFRSELPGYPARAAGIAREVAAGRYHRVSHGIRAALRDTLRTPLFEPAIPRRTS